MQERLKVEADAVAILDYEGAGHVGLDYVSNFALIRKAVKALKIHVVAAGAISDAASFVAALALGSDGMLVGTAFMLAKESTAHNRIKQWMFKSTENDTMLIQQSIRNTARVLKNKPAIKTMEMENKGASLGELLPVISGLKEKELLETGNREAGIVQCGQVIGMIDLEKTVNEVIQEMVDGAQLVSDRLKSLGVFS